MVYLCNYRSDLGLVRKRIKPFIQGFSKGDNKIIPAQKSLLIVSNYISIDSYFEGDNKSGYCQAIVKPRRLKYEDSQHVIELEYPLPFTDIDWSLIKAEMVTIKTIGEKISDSIIQLPLFKIA